MVITKSSCRSCDGAITSKQLTCKGCGVSYHRTCRLGLGRCLSDGCSRSKPIRTHTPTPDALLDRDVSDMFGPHHDGLGRPVVSTGVGLLGIAVVIGILVGRGLFL